MEQCCGAGRICKSDRIAEVNDGLRMAFKNTSISSKCGGRVDLAVVDWDGFRRFAPWLVPAEIVRKYF